MEKPEQPIIDYLLTCDECGNDQFYFLTSGDIDPEKKVIIQCDHCGRETEQTVGIGINVYVEEEPTSN